MKLTNEIARFDNGSWHPVLTTDIHGTQRFCAYSWCDGSCGFPALVIPSEGERSEHKIMGDMVAVGKLAQPWRVKWTGAKVEVPASDWPHLLKSFWW